MGLALWFTIRAGGRRIPLPLILLLPVFLVLDILALLILLPLGILKKNMLFVEIGVGFILTRLIAGLILYGGGFRVRVRDGNSRVEVRGGWTP